MMRLTRRAVLLPVAFYLLPSAETAHAECAWVLWNDEARLDYGTNTESRFWHPIAGVSRKPDCEARLRQEIEQVTHPDNPPKDVLFKIARIQTFRYVCLPDTVDPRGSKGK